MLEKLDPSVRSVMERIDVPYEVVDCDPELADTANFVKAYGYSLEDSANAIVVIGKSDPPRYVACVVLANTRLDVNRAVKRKLGARASFASAEDVARLTGMTLGGVTPIGITEMPIWVDARVMSRPRIIIGGGNRSSKILTSPEIFRSLPNAEIVEGLASDVMVSGDTSLSSRA
jgi:prolyl-tRNA editing enzyme YbaK/EbsC (Cys-tRNA(Pro) deacylase)